MAKVLAITPGSTSTKIGIYEDKKLVFEVNIKHTADELAPFEHITDEYDFRKEVIMAKLAEKKVDLGTIDCVVGRGGLINPVPSGAYIVNDAIKRDLVHSPLGEHASNLGGLIADDIAQSLPKDVKAYIADPVVVDEMQEVARVSGHPRFQRLSIFHALNQKAIARQHAKKIGKKYENLNLIVVHLGGGISVGAHQKGQVIDVNNALDGDGPFSPERSGGLPVGQLAKLCFSGKVTLAEVKKMIKGEGGFVSYLDTNDAYKVEKDAVAGDNKTKLVQEALFYQVGKEIAQMAAVLHGKVDAILLTGGIAKNPFLVDYVTEMVGFISEIAVYPGEDELFSLANNGFMILDGELEAKIYE